MAHPTVMFDRVRLQKARLSYDSSYPCAQDYDLWCRAVEDLSLANLPEVLLVRRLHAGQVGRRDANGQQRWAAAIRRRQLERLGIRPTEEQAAVHEAIVRGPGRGRNRSWKTPKPGCACFGSPTGPMSLILNRNSQPSSGNGGWPFADRWRLSWDGGSGILR